MTPRQQCAMRSTQHKARLSVGLGQGLLPPCHLPMAIPAPGAHCPTETLIFCAQPGRWVNVEGENAPMGLKSKGQWLSLHSLWLCIIHVSAPFSCKPSKLLLNLQASASSSGKLSLICPTPNSSPAPTALWAPAVALHSTSQVPVYLSAFPVRLGLYLFIFPPAAQHLSVFAEGMPPLLPTHNHLIHFCSWSHQPW